VLAAGEIGFETDTTKFKFGDGTTVWANIPYFASADDLIDGAPELLDTLNELAASIGDDPDFFNTINNKIDSKASIIVQNSIPQYGPGGSPETPQTGDLWLDTSSLRLYSYFENGENTPYWLEVGGTIGLDGADLATAASFPEEKGNGDEHNGYVYDNTRNAWNVKHENLEDADNVAISTLAQDNVLMYNNNDSSWENVAGVRLDENGYIPATFLSNLVGAVGASGVETLADVESYIDTNFALLAETSKLTVKTTADWSADTSTPLAGSLNIELGSEVRIKIGTGTDTFADLDYVPSIGSVDTAIANGTAPLAPKADPTFSGTVSLPSTTSIGDVDATEISHLDGVTSGIQGQLDSLDTLKAPIADPTFTGTVSGITKSMVGLGNVDNTADIDKPVSTAQQTALDTKLNLAGGTMTGKITLDGDPTQALHAVTKQYVDGVEAGLITRPQVEAATTENLDGAYDNGAAGVGATLNLGPLEELDIDGVTVWYQFDGILVKDQTNAAENGRYVVLQVGQSGYDLEDVDWILRRCSLCDTADEIPGSYIFVLDGITNEQTGWVQHVADPATFTVGTDDIDVYQFAGAGSVTAGTNVSVVGNQISVVDAPVFTGTVDASAAGVEFSDGTQTQAGVPSLTTFVEKTASYQLDTLDHKDNVVEMNMATAGTFTVPLDATLSWPVGASMDIFATGAGEITIAGEAGVTLNATPGLILRTQWSSATILKRGADNWVVYGDLKA
jgi:hypothetical protein